MLDDRVAAVVRCVTDARAEKGILIDFTSMQPKIVGPGGRGDPPEELEFTEIYVALAMTLRQKIEIHYVDYNLNETVRVIEPLEWIDQDKFEACCCLRREKRHFVLSGITQFRLL